MSKTVDRALLEELSRLVEHAGKLVLEVYATDFDVVEKGPNDPVTLADKNANDYLCDGLGAAFPGVPIVAEESEGARYAGFATASAAFFVDPLDGTREFVAKNGEFVVMVGLSIDGRAVAGAIHSPVRRLTWFGGSGLGAFERAPSGDTPLTIADAERVTDARLVVSRSRRSPVLDALIEREKPREIRPMGSAGLKAVSVARGDADLYLQLGRAGSLWDMCGPDAIVTAAGGRFTQETGEPIDYRTEDVLVRTGVVAAGPRLHAAALAALVSSKHA